MVAYIDIGLALVKVFAAQVYFLPRKNGRTMPGSRTSMNTVKTNKTQNEYSLRRNDLTIFKTCL